MTILERIVESKRKEVAALPRRPLDQGVLAWGLTAFGPRRGFAGALRVSRRGPLALIAEIKKASPSVGVIRADFDPVSIAQAYELAGATCLSVLTDGPFFQGHLDHLRQVRRAVQLPLLRKDFIIDERQIYESLEWGADAILLIASILTDEELRRFRILAQEAGVDALVEVHDEEELDRALESGARLVGVNNRDLRTFKIDLGVTERLSARLRERGAEVTLVAESGIRIRTDVERLVRAGAQALLVGESLMREADLVAKVGELLGD